MDRFTALLDANVLYPATLRDLLMRLASRNLYRAKWSAHIHAEWMRAVRRDHPNITTEQLERTRSKMDGIGDCVVTKYERLIPRMNLPHEEDNHVLAAAIRGRADVIVTQNLKHFPPEILSEYDLAAQHPDVFLTHIIDLYPGQFASAAKEHRLSLSRPAQTPNEYLNSLKKQGIVQTVTELRQFIDVI